MPHIKADIDFTFAVTGTFHGSTVIAGSEGEARKIFHKYYNGESIIKIELRKIQFKNDKDVILELIENGNIFVHGKLIENDKGVFDALNEFLISQNFY